MFHIRLGILALALSCALAAESVIAVASNTIYPARPNWHKETFYASSDCSSVEYHSEHAAGSGSDILERESAKIFKLHNTCILQSIDRKKIHGLSARNDKQPLYKRFQLQPQSRANFIAMLPNVANTLYMS